MAGISPLRAPSGPRDYVKPATLSLAVSLLACASSTWAASDVWMKPLVLDGPPPLNSGMWLSRAPDGGLMAVYRTPDQAAGPSTEIANLVITRLSADSVQEWTAVWGAAPGTTDDRPSNVAQDAAGNLYIVDGYAYVAKFSAPGAPLWTYTHEDALPGDCTMRHHRSAVTPDGSVFYSAECSDGSLIGRISTAGEREWELRLDTVATNAQDPFIPDATAVSATGVSVSPDGGTVYVTGSYAAPNAGAANGFVLPLAVADETPDLDAVRDQGEFCESPQRSEAIADDGGDALLLACADNSLMKIDAASLAVLWRSPSAPAAPQPGDGPPVPVAMSTDEAGRACVLEQTARAPAGGPDTMFVALTCFDSTGPRRWRRPLAADGSSGAAVTAGPAGSYLLGTVLTADYRGLSTALRPQAVILPVTAAGRVTPNTAVAAAPLALGDGDGFVASRWDGAGDLTYLTGATPTIETAASTIVDMAVDPVDRGRAIALQIRSTGEVNAKIWYLKSGNPAGSVRFGKAYQPLALLSLEDGEGGLGGRALGAFGRDDAGRSRVQVKSYPAGEAVSTVWFGTTFAPIDALVLPDQDGNLAEEIAVLGVNESGKTRVQIKDSLDGVNVKQLYFGWPHAVHGFTAIPDLDGNGRPEIGVLITNRSGERVLRVADSETGTILNRIGFSRGYYPSAIVTVPDAGDGMILVGVMGEDATGRKRIQLRDARTGANRGYQFYDRTRVAEDVFVMDDRGGDGAMDIGVVLRDPRGQAILQVRDSRSSSRVVFPID